MLVMPGLGPGIHVFASAQENVDGRDKPSHDDGETSALEPPQRPKVSRSSSFY
jgi:hypothetical protein